MKRKPIFVTVLGLCSTLLWGVLTVRLYVIPAPQYSREDIVVVEGNVDHSEEFGGSSPTLQVWLKNVESSFRSSGPYPRYYDRDILAELRPGVPVKIGITPAEQTSARYDRMRAEEWRNIYSLEANGRVALSLHGYNGWSINNNRVGQIVVPILLTCSVGLLAWGVFGWRRVVSTRPKTLPEGGKDDMYEVHI
jgi:hypothetical protein